jgi:hypothetical protein
MSRDRWYRGVPPVVAELLVDDGVVHHIAWRRGRLTLIEHPDPTGELALAALGGERCVCFDVLDAWRTRPREVLWRALEWGGGPVRGSNISFRAATLQAQAHAQLLTTSPGVLQARRSRRMLRQQRVAGFVGAQPGARWGVPEVLEQQLREQMMAMLPPALIERIALAVLVQDHRAGQAATTLPMLNMRTHVVDALERCIRSWGPHRRPPTVDLDLWVTDQAAPDVVGLVERDLGFVVAILPERWLLAVYARQVEVVDGCFVLDARLHHADAGEVDAVRFERTGPSGWTPVTNTLPVARSPAGTWHVTG